VVVGKLRLEKLFRLFSYRCRFGYNWCIYDWSFNNFNNAGNFSNNRF
jgi:hypothetical protein